MSLILDALKKLEQEKAARRDKRMEISPAMLTASSRRSSRPRISLLLAGSAIVLIIATFSILKLWIKQETPSLSQTAENRTTGSASQSGSSPVAAVSPPETPAPAKPETLPPSPPSTRFSNPGTPPPYPAAMETAITTPDSSALKVTGIAWQDERSGRRAVINGSLLGEGSTVAGARIAEIHPDRVRFVLNGRTFEILLTTSFVGN